MENQIEVKTNKGIEYVIRRKNGFEYIFAGGKLIIYEPFYFVARGTTPINGQDYILVRKINNKMNYVSFDGEFLLDDDYTEIDPYVKNNLIIVRERGLNNFAKITDGKLLFDKWFDRVDYFHDGFARVERDSKCNLIGEDGKLISDEWFKSVDYFDNDGFAVVERTNGEQCKIDKNGKIVVRK